MEARTERIRYHVRRPHPTEMTDLPASVTPETGQSPACGPGGASFGFVPVFPLPRLHPPKVRSLQVDQAASGGSSGLPWVAWSRSVGVGGCPRGGRPGFEGYPADFRRVVDLVEVGRQVVAELGISWMSHGVTSEGPTPGGSGRSRAVLHAGTARQHPRSCLTPCPLQREETRMRNGGYSRTGGTCQRRHCV